MMRPFLCTLAGFPFLMLAQTTIEWSAPITCAPAAQGCTRPRIVVNGDDRPVVLWGRETGMKANFVAVGNGAGFNMPVQVTYMGAPPAIDYWMGGDIAALGNELWMSFKATPENTMPIYARRSLDGGTTWGDTIRISNDPWARFPGITIGTAGEPVVQFMRFEPNFLEPHQVTSRMSSGQFQPPVDVSTPFAPGEVCDCCPGQVLAQGNVIVPMYRNAGPNIRVIYGAVSNDGGASYAIGGLIDPSNWTLAACPSSGPDGYIKGDSVRYVWMTGAVNGSKVNMATAALSDLAVGPRVLVHPGQPSSTIQNYPRIAGSGDTLGVVWEQTVAGDENILFSFSTTGVHGLSVPDTVNISTSGAQRTPDIAYANGAFHIVWSDEATGTVNYRVATVTNATGMPTQDMLPEFTAWPVPASNTLQVALPANVRAILRVFDASGKCMLTSSVGTTQLDVSTLVPGRYVLQATSTEGRSLGQLPVQIVR